MKTVISTFSQDKTKHQNSTIDVYCIQYTGIINLDAGLKKDNHAHRHLHINLLFWGKLFGMSPFGHHIIMKLLRILLPPKYYFREYHPYPVQPPYPGACPRTGW